MVVALPQRRSMGLGSPMTAKEREAWARDTVNLFLNGCRDCPAHCPVNNDHHSG